MKKQKLLFVIVVAIIISAFIGTTVNAMQSRPDGTSLTNKNANYFFTEIRKMETTVLGLETNFDATTWLDTSGNGVDVHMAKNTEWGTAAMLSASAYGIAPSGASSASTTGNSTGVYQMAGVKFEVVSGIYNLTSIAKNDVSNIIAANSRYKNVYTSQNAIDGDATTETSGWKNSTYKNFISSYNSSSYSYAVFYRGGKGIFSYHNGSESNVGDLRYGVDSGKASGNNTSRAAMVIGAGL